MWSNYENSEWRLSLVGIRASPSRVKKFIGKSLASSISTTKEFVYLMKETLLPVHEDFHLRINPSYKMIDLGFSGRQL
jgi:hypothetical protein